MAALGAFVHLPLSRTFFPPSMGLASIAKTTVMQIYFTGVQALPLFFFISLVIGLSVGLVSNLASNIEAIICNLVLKSATPILAALIILGRSGPAITVELGNMTVSGEIQQLRRMGIDPFQHIVFPRIVGVTAATLFTGIYFGIFIALSMAIFSTEPFHLFIRRLMDEWTVLDVVLVAEKEFFFGLIISIVACYQGLGLIHATTEVPKATIKTVIHCIILCATTDFILRIVAA